jgi:hypothetical protein
LPVLPCPEIAGFQLSTEAGDGAGIERQWGLSPAAHAHHFLAMGKSGSQTVTGMAINIMSQAQPVVNQPGCAPVADAFNQMLKLDTEHDARDIGFLEAISASGRVPDFRKFRRNFYLVTRAAA